MTTIQLLVDAVGKPIGKAYASEAAAYASVDAATEAEAISDVEAHGHHAVVSAMPLLTNVMGRSPNAAKTCRTGVESGPILGARP